MKELFPVRLLATILMLGASALAQVHGVPSSVFSPRGDDALANPNGVPASVTSLGPNGFGDAHQHRGRFVPVVPIIFPVPVVPVVMVPADYEAGPQPQVMYSSYSSRREPPPTQYVYEPVREPAPEKTRVIIVDAADVEHVRPVTSETKPAEPKPKVEEKAPERPRLATVLVFRDGHKQEVSDYAIMQSTLYDFTSGATHKIALNDLDLPATEKENASRGTEFHLPSAL
jgi:hypothetical protein